MKSLTLLFILEEEKKQIVDACDYGLRTDPNVEQDVVFSGKNYYKNTYNEK